jgi:serine/threonine protein kinase
MPTADIVLADFGWSVNTPFSRRKTMCGTSDYLLPEMIAGNTDNEHVDRWCDNVMSFQKEGHHLNTVIQ